MALSKMKQIVHKGSHVLLSLTLVVLEKVVQNDFVCPCRRDFTMWFFFVYLLGPTSITLIFGFLLLRLNSNFSSGGFCYFISCLVPPAVWLAMFFSNGRYVACFYAELKGGYAESDEQFPWDPCVKNRTLTEDQKQCQVVFFTTKLAGFGVLIFISAAVLIYEYSKKRTQPESEEDQQSGMPLQERVQN